MHGAGTEHLLERDACLSQKCGFDICMPCMEKSRDREQRDGACQLHKFDESDAFKRRSKLRAQLEAQGLNNRKNPTRGRKGFSRSVERWEDVANGSRFAPLAQVVQELGVPSEHWKLRARVLNQQFTLKVASVSFGTLRLRAPGLRLRLIRHSAGSDRHAFAFDIPPSLSVSLQQSHWS